MSRTTILGVVAIVGATANLLTVMLNGGDLNAAWMAVLTALNGAGLVFARDDK